MDTNKPIVIEGWASSYSKRDEGYYFAPGEPILSHQRPATLVINDKAIPESTVKERERELKAMLDEAMNVMQTLIDNLPDGFNRNPMSLINAKAHVAEYRLRTQPTEQP